MARKPRPVDPKPQKPDGRGATESDLLVDRGFDRISESSFEVAKEYFDEALRLHPSHPRALQGRGLAWQYLKELANALVDFDAAIRLNPADARSYLNRGTIRAWRGEADEAAADYTAALGIDPTMADAHRFRAMVRLKQERWDEAVQDFSEVIRRRPADPTAYCERAGALLNLNATDRALADFNEALRLDPRMLEALTPRATLYQQLGQHGKAEDDAARIRAITAVRVASSGSRKRTLITSLLREHFHPDTIDQLTITERQFPFRVRADLQRATKSLFTGKTRVVHVCGVRQSYSHEGLDMTGLLVAQDHNPPLSVPLEHEEIDVGEEAPVRCPKNALWLLEEGGHKYAVLLCPAGQYGQITGLKFQVTTVNKPEGTQLTQAFFKHLEDSVLRSESYRGKVLSLEARDAYSGRSSGILVHRLKRVERGQVILPQQTLELLDRNVLTFSSQRKQLGRFGQATKKGILLHGPPGTGKTHTIHYLIGALEGHTTFLITAGQMGLLSEYLTLARLLQPSIVVIEDVDLIARDRETINNACAESLLNLLLNEMDGLRQDADVFFILTTNRPESLEEALASRPGRVDQAIEYPLPDAGCRAKLLRLYSQGLTLSEDLTNGTVDRTKGVSASFIRELMRRSAQFHLERGATTGEISDGDIRSALDELLVKGGKFNRRFLGGDAGSPGP